MRTRVQAIAHSDIRNPGRIKENHFMQGHTHIGLALALTYGVLLPVGFDLGAAVYEPSNPFGLSSPHPIATGLAVVLGALAPDLDHSGSIIARPGNLLRPILPRYVRKALNLGGQVVSRGIGLVSPHRGVLHYPLTAIGLGVIGITIHSPLMTWFSWGYVTHLLGDFCTVKGIPVFGPFSRRGVDWSPIRTGGLIEGLLSLVFWCGAIASVYFYLPESQQRWIHENAAALYHMHLAQYFLAQ